MYVLICHVFSKMAEDVHGLLTTTAANRSFSLFTPVLNKQRMFELVFASKLQESTSHATNPFALISRNYPFRVLCLLCTKKIDAFWACERVPDLRVDERFILLLCDDDVFHKISANSRLIFSCNMP